jgi:hypothetical protein
MLTIIYEGPVIFSLPYESKDPYFATEEWLALNAGSGLVVGAPTNHCLMATIMFQAFVFMQLFN